MRQAVNRLEDAGYVSYETGSLSSKNAYATQPASSSLPAPASAPSIKEAYVIPQFGDWPFAFARINAVYVWTQSTPHDELVDRLQQHDGPRTVAILEEVDLSKDHSVIYDLQSIGDAKC